MGNKSGFDFWKGFNAFICAFFLSAGLTILLAFFISKLAGFGFILSLFGFTYFLYVKIDSIKRVWGRTFIGLAIEFFALPVISYISSIIFIYSESSNAAEVLVKAMLGSMFIVFTAIIGIVFGVVFLIIGIFTLKSANKKTVTSGK